MLLPLNISRPRSAIWLSLLGLMLAVEGNCVPQSVAQDLERSGLVITIKADADSFSKAKPVGVEVFIKNSSNQQAIYPKITAFGPLKMIVRDEKRKLIIPRPEPIIDKAFEMFDTLRPHESDTLTVELSITHGNDTSTFGAEAEFMPGEYSVTARLGSLQSNEIGFKVTDLSVMDATVRRMYHEVMEFGKYRGISRIGKLEGLLQDYPNSEYYERITTSLLTEYYMNSVVDPQSCDRVKSLGIRYFKSFPNSPLIQMALNYFVHCLKPDRDPRNIYSQRELQQIISTHLEDIREGIRSARFEKAISTYIKNFSASP